MIHVFDDEYYESGKEEEEEMAAKDRKLNLQLLKDKKVEVQEYDAEKESGEYSLNEEDFEREVVAVRKPKKNQPHIELEENLAQFDTWFVCDECQKPIEALKNRYDCQVCDNFTFCEKCYSKNSKHLHKFKKEKVGAKEGPPQKYAELLIQKAYMLCFVCKDSLLAQNKRAYKCPKREIYFCKKCKEETEEVGLEKVRDKDEPADQKNPQLDELL